MVYIYFHTYPSASAAGAPAVVVVAVGSMVDGVGLPPSVLSLNKHL